MIKPGSSQQPVDTNPGMAQAKQLDGQIHSLTHQQVSSWWTFWVQTPEDLVPPTREPRTWPYPLVGKHQHHDPWALWPELPGPDSAHSWIPAPGYLQHCSQSLFKTWANHQKPGTTLRRTTLVGPGSWHNPPACQHHVWTTQIPQPAMSETSPAHQQVDISPRNPDPAASHPKTQLQAPVD